MDIKISVANKVATPEEGAKIICGNSDYVIAFDFDSPWDEYGLKTARFTYTRQGKVYYEEVVFDGNRCPVPILYSILEVKIGVYAGNLSTSTAAVVPCEKSILCGDPVHDEPPEDVYNQIMEALKAFEIVCIVTELPVEGVENKTYFVAKTDGEGNDLYDEYMWVGGAWEYIGTKQIEIDLTDYVKKTDYPDAGDKAGVVKANSGAYGIGVYPTNGYLYIAPASNEEIDAKTHARRPIVPSNLDYAIKVGLTTNANKLTEQEQVAIHKWLGLTTATNEARPYTIVKRTAGGVIFVGEPTDDRHATTKGYVDGLIAELEARIAALENK